MKKFTSLLIGCSLALAGAALAQQPDDQASPKPQAVEKGRGKAVEAKPKTNVNPNATANPNALKSEGAAVERRGTKDVPTGPKIEKNTPTTTKVEKLETATPKPAPSIPTRTKVNKVATDKVATEPGASPMPSVNKQGDERRKGMKNPTGAATTSPTPKVTATAAATVAPVATPTPAAKVVATPAPTATATATVAASATPAATAAPLAGVAAEQTGRRNPAAPKKPDQQKVEQIKVEHANFRAQPKPDKVPAVTFTESRRIEGSDRWQGQKYEAFRSYRAERHDERYYHSRYSRVELIGGGYYYLNNGYWYPAWGYNDAHQYYAYDGPIYVGHNAAPLDHVIADVQGVLQEMGYYKGEVDGLLGPLTRQALTDYQVDQGLSATAAIDEPTLDALGMG